MMKIIKKRKSQNQLVESSHSDKQSFAKVRAGRSLSAGAEECDLYKLGKCTSQARIQNGSGMCGSVGSVCHRIRVFISVNAATYTEIFN